MWICSSTSHMPVSQIMCFTMILWCVALLFEIRLGVLVVLFRLSWVLLEQPCFVIVCEVNLTSFHWNILVLHAVVVETHMFSRFRWTMWRRCLWFVYVFVVCVMCSATRHVRAYGLFVWPQCNVFRRCLSTIHLFVIVCVSERWLCFNPRWLHVFQQNICWFGLVCVRTTCLFVCSVGKLSICSHDYLEEQTITMYVF